MKYRIGFIGMGKMGQAIWQGLDSLKIIDHNHVFFNEISEELTEYVKANFNLKEKNLPDLINDCDILFICVKPQNLEHLLKIFVHHNLENKLIISILAGTPIKKYTEILGKNLQIIRVMPNTPLLVKAGMTALCYNKGTKKEYLAFAEQLFQSLGEYLEVEEEFMDLITGLSGSGPAFFYRIAHDLAELATEYNLDYAKGLKLVAQTLIGTGKMLLESNKTPAELIKAVTSPNGTTEAGLKYFDQTKIDEEIKKVVISAIDRSIELNNVR